MRLATFVPVGGRAGRPGFVLGDYLLEAGAFLRWARRRGLPGVARLRRQALPETMVDLLAGGWEALLAWRDLLAQVEGDPPLLAELRAQGALWPMQEVRLRPPVERPPSIRDFMGFEGHVRNARLRRGGDVPPRWYEMPVFYFSNPGALYGPEETVPCPSYTERLDFELELACVITGTGRNIPPERAEEHIAGFTLFNDWSARDIQFREMEVGLGPAKGKDFASSLGPWLVTLDEFQDRALGDGRYDIPLTARVNGRTYTEGNYREVHWTFRQMVAHASREVTLYPGDILGSGTVTWGCILELEPQGFPWLRPGDVVELEAGGIGVLRNRIGRRPA